VIGKATAKMVSVFNFTKMEINTRVCGVRTIDTAKALTGEMKAGN